MEEDHVLKRYKDLKIALENARVVSHGCLNTQGLDEYDRAVIDEVDTGLVALKRKVDERAKERLLRAWNRVKA